ncbi:MAG: hypothetical protein ABI867_36960 [Kofleriaceae bacterium]
MKKTTKRLLLATAALSTSIACGGKKSTPRIYSNPKGPKYDMQDAGTEPDAPPPDDTGSGSGSAQP